MLKAFTSRGSSASDGFHNSFLNAICARDNGIKSSVDALDAEGRRYQYIASMSSDELDAAPIPEKIEPLGLEMTIGFW